MQKLDAQYIAIINEQRSYLAQLQNEFNAVCDKLTKEAEEKIKNLSPDDKEGKQTILRQLKASINEELARLKSKTHESQNASIKKLEEINLQRETQLLDNLGSLIDGV